jgi:hypothetical protein
VRFHFHLTTFRSDERSFLLRNAFALRPNAVFYDAAFDRVRRRIDLSGASGAGVDRVVL